VDLRIWNGVPVRGVRRGGKGLLRASCKATAGRVVPAPESPLPPTVQATRVAIMLALATQPNLGPRHASNPKHL